jgi:aminopeptidase N
MQARRSLPGLVALLVLALAPLAAGAEAVHHLLDVRLDPQAQQLEVRDTITLPASVPDTMTMRLHAGLRPQVVAGEADLTRIDGVKAEGGVSIESYRVVLRAGARRFTLEYGGRIHHPVSDIGEEYARSFGVSPGLIAADGVFLAGSSYWHPHFEEAPLVTFAMTVRLPDPWRSVSQGKRDARAAEAGDVKETWRESHPQEEIFLIAAPFTEYTRSGGKADAMVFLRKPDAPLAARYLELTGRYQRMYEDLIGPYPYEKFALVENFWETGYGMPSFTLLGPQVIRLPFIPYTSYPHEILHNWWGNGVYVDYASGNWAEGLTSYLADHLLKEQRREGAEHRRAALQKYADYVREQKDFALTEFRGRHSSVTEAVGYGKALMVYHMLRGLIGDEAFVGGLRRFYADNAFKVAGWSDLARAFEQSSGLPLEPFFAQWLARPGAPALRLRDVTSQPSGSGFVLRGVIEQTQSGEPYVLRVPVAVQLEGREQAVLHTVAMEGRSLPFELELPAPPLRVAIDPAFDLFRRLQRQEIPPAVSQAMGADRVLVVLPASASDALRTAYAELVRAWQRGRDAKLEMRRDDELDALPDDRTVWLLGWENRFRSAMHEALAGYDVKPEADRVILDGRAWERSQHSVVLLGRNARSPDHALAWIAAHDGAAVSGLARKLPHYGKYGYLAFSGTAPDNVLKGEWPVTGSPLVVDLVGGGAPPLKLEARRALAELPPAFDRERMMDDVQRLSDLRLAGRGLGTPGLDEAAHYIAEQFRAAGLEPARDATSYLQTWQARAGQPVRDMTLRNVVGVIRGSDPQRRHELIVIGAHYDHLGLGWPDVRAGNTGKVHPGADDNASGVAVLLELARVLASGAPPARSIVFVAFTGEEADRLGSRHYVQSLRTDSGAKVIGMLNLDTVGRLADGPLYAIGTSSAREWPHILRGAGFVSGVRVEAVAEQLESSDQVSFADAGVPAVQLFSGAHGDYHRPTDTPDKVSAEGLVKVAAVTREAIDYLAGEQGRLTAAGTQAPTSGADQRQARRAALGTVPDFAYAGPGVRLSGVNSGSPAEAAGLRAGDILTAVNQRAVNSLKEYAEVLRGLAPGDAVQIEFLRDGAARTVDARVVAR